MDVFADATRRLWLACLRNAMPLERAEVMIKEPAALDMAAAIVLTRYPALSQPRRLIRQRGYFVARVLSVHTRSVVLMLPDADSTTITVSRGVYVRNDAAAVVDFKTTYPTAHDGHFMFRRMENGTKIRRVRAIHHAKFLR